MAVETPSRSGLPDQRARVPAKDAGLWWKLLGAGLWPVIALAGCLVWVGPVPTFTLGGHASKIIFFHVPCAWMAFVGFVVAAWQSAQHLAASRAGDAQAEDPAQEARAARLAPIVVLGLLVTLGLPGAWRLLALIPIALLARLSWRPSALSDLRAAAAMEVGLVMAVLATITGSIFSHYMWGAYWSWDPRQTSIVVVLLILAAYVVLRGSVDDERRRGRLSSVYALVALVPGFFLIWVLPRVVGNTLHSGPNETLVREQLGLSYRIGMYALALPAFVAIFSWMCELSVRLSRLQMAVERQADGQSGTLGGSSA